MSIPFTADMKKDYTLLVPNMLPVHFSIIKEIFTNHGYKIDVLDNDGPNVIREGMRYVHNDICYPAQLVIGQFLDALSSGKYDTHKVALLLSQTGGGCRASNYIYLLKKALDAAKMPYIPVISVDFKGLDENPGFKLTPIMIGQGYAGALYGDLIMCVSNQVRPYELHKGDTRKTMDKWVAILAERFKKNRHYWGKYMTRNFQEIVRDFAAIPVRKTPKIKVGIVGEIYMKYSRLGNNNLQQFLEDNGCEVMIPSLMNFFYYGFDNAHLDRKYYGHLFWQSFMTQWLMRHFFLKGEKKMLDAIRQGGFVTPTPYRKEKALDKGVLDYGVKMGEGWLLTAEMLELVNLGYKNIICTQPFGCLPNHIVAKGMIHTVRSLAPDSNIVPIDYDPSASHVNQENRIKLMLAVARENLDKELQKQKT